MGNLTYHEDALGSVRLVTSSSGTLFSADYKPYGTIYGGWGSSTFQYTSKAADTAAGFLYSGANWCDTNEA